jgi:hypothetical protein
MPKLVEAGVDALFETIRPKEQDTLTDLLVSLLRRNAYSADDFVAGLRAKTDQLKDLACALAPALAPPPVSPTSPPDLNSSFVQNKKRRKRVFLVYISTLACMAPGAGPLQRAPAGGIVAAESKDC